MRREVAIAQALAVYGQTQFEHRKKLQRASKSDEKDHDIQTILSRGFVAQRNETAILHRRVRAKQAEGLLQVVGGKNTDSDYKPAPGLIRELREELDEDISLDYFEFIAANDFNGYLTFFYVCQPNKVYTQEDLNKRPNKKDQLEVIHFANLRRLITEGQIAFDHPYYIKAALDLLGMGYYL